MSKMPECVQFKPTQSCFEDWLRMNTQRSCWRQQRVTETFGFCSRNRELHQRLEVLKPEESDGKSLVWVAWIGLSSPLLVGQIELSFWWRCASVQLAFPLTCSFRHYVVSMPEMVPLWHENDSSCCACWFQGRQLCFAWMWQTCQWDIQEYTWYSCQVHPTENWSEV